MRKKLLKTALAFAVLTGSLAAAAVTASAQPAESDYEFIVLTGNKVSITGFNEDYVGAVDIPSTLQGYPVVDIAQNAFNNCDNITSVTIPEGISSIPYRTFYDCDNITNVTLPSSIKK